MSPRLHAEGLVDGPPPIIISSEEEARYLAEEAAAVPYDSYCWTVLRLSAYIEYVLEEFELTRRQYSVLAVLAHGPMSLTALARSANVTPPSVTIMVRGLLKKGVVTRSLSSTDQRRIWIGLSEDGQRKLKEIDEKAKERLMDIGAFSAKPDQAEADMEALGMWGDTLNRFREEWLRRHNG